MQRYTSVQKLRGILFLMIFVFYCGIPGTGVFWGGVEIFLLLSGFFIARNSLNLSQHTVIESCKRKIRKLYQSYIVLIMGCTLVALCARKIPWDAFLHLGFLQNFYWMIKRYQFNMLLFTAHTWTMPIEVFVSLLIICIYGAVKNEEKRKMALALLLIVSILYRTILSVCFQNDYLISLFQLAYADAFPLGCLLFENIKKKASLSAILIGFAGIIGICVIVIAGAQRTDFFSAYNFLKTSDSYLRNPFIANLYLFISAVSFSIVYFLVEFEEKNNLSRKSVLIWIGDKSYELHLFHYPVWGLSFAILRRVFGVQDLYVCAFIALLLTFATSLVYKSFTVLLQRGLLKHDTII